MERRHEFKGAYKIGGEAGTSLIYRLAVLTDDIDSQNAYRLANAVDREYKQLLMEQYGTGEKGVFEGWQQGSPLS